MDIIDNQIKQTFDKSRFPILELLKFKFFISAKMDFARFPEVCFKPAIVEWSFIITKGFHLNINDFFYNLIFSSWEFRLIHEWKFV